MKKLIWGAILLCYASCVLATRFIDYLPMEDSEYGQKREQTPLLMMPGQVEPGQYWHFAEVGVAGVTLQPMPEEADGWRFIGKDTTGKSWEVPLEYLHNAAGNAEIYRADLDRNGIQDLIVWKGYSGVGLSPTAQLILITFKSHGRPCVFEPWGFYTTGRAGVEDILDLQNNGHTQLLDMHFSEGYWITDLYHVNDAHWRRVDGWFGKLKYPALTRFTYCPNRKQVSKPGAGRYPETENQAATQLCL